MIDVKRFEEIKAKITALKEKKSRADGAIETIQADWKRLYGVSTLEEVEALIDSKKKEMQENDALIEKWYEELKGLTNWGLV